MCWFRLCSQDVAGGERWVCCVWQLCAPASLAEAVRGWLGLGAFLLLGLLCCSPAAHVLLCPAAMAVLLYCSHLLLWHLWELHASVVLLVCCRGAMAAVAGTWGAEQGHPQQPWLGLVPWLS